MATDGDSKNHKPRKNGGSGSASSSSSTPSETDSALAKDTSKSLSLQAEADEATSTSLSMESITIGKNDRGIPAAKFIEDSDVFAESFAPRKAHEKECKRQGKELKADAGAATKADSSSEASTAETAETVEIERLKISNGTQDSDLFATPPPRDDCPICMLPLPIPSDESTYQPCCGKMVCCGCKMESDRVFLEENNERMANGDPRPLLEDCCPFCRKPAPKSDNEILDRLRKRMDLGDARAFHQIAWIYKEGSYGMLKDERKAFDHYIRAAELGSIEACYVPATHYYKHGKVVRKNLAKCRYYLELAAKGGGVDARHELGLIEVEEGNYILAVRHFLIAALAGDDESLEHVSLGYRNGLVSKDEYASALRAHQKARDEMKSDERDRFAADQKRQLR